MESDVHIRLPEHVREKQERAEGLQEVLSGKDDMVQSILEEIEAAR